MECVFRNSAISVILVCVYSNLLRLQNWNSCSCSSIHTSLFILYGILLANWNLQSISEYDFLIGFNFLLGIIPGISVFNLISLEILLKEMSKF